MNFKDLMAELQTEYLNSLPKKIDTIRTLAQLKKTTDLQFIFHNFKGSGSTYGLDEVSALGGLMENLLIKSPRTALEQTPNCCTLLENIYKKYSKSEVDFDMKTDPHFESLESALHQVA